LQTEVCARADPTTERERPISTYKSGLFSTVRDSEWSGLNDDIWPFATANGTESIDTFVT